MLIELSLSSEDVPKIVLEAMIFDRDSTPYNNEYNDILCGDEHELILLSRNLSYNLYGHSPVAALFPMSHIQPCSKPCAQLLYRALFARI